MGHERVGTLPRTKRWQNLISDISIIEEQKQPQIATIVKKTLDNVRTRYNRIYKDTGVQAAFGFLVSLAINNLAQSVGFSSAEVKLDDNPSTVRLAQLLNIWVSKHAGSMEYAEIARRAGSDTIARWTQQKSVQGHLFSKDYDAKNVWNYASNAKGFCEVARIFFAKFTERYLRYFLERAASAELSSLSIREDFSRRLQSHLDDVSKHAFETSKITQSFAAGWFNKHALETRPSDSEIEGFLAIAFGKLQEELRRESIE